MAKKQTMNFFEANIEKIVIAIAVLFLGWVVYANIINAPGIKTGSEVVTGVEATSQARDMARTVVQGMSRDASTEGIEPYQPIGDLLSLVKPTKIDEVALLPPDMTRFIQEQDVRNYVIPTLPELTDVKIKVTSSLAYVPNEDDAEAQDPMAGRIGVAAATDSELKDVTFVSVEATVDMETIYDSFTKAFTGSQVNKPLEEYYTPIVASIDLLRSELKEDGTWSEPVSVPRAKVDPLRNSLDVNDFRNISKARHGVAMRDNSTDNIQINLLQPPAYTLANGTWTNPSAEAEEADNTRRNVQPATNDPRAAATNDPRAMAADPRRAAANTATVSDLKVKDLKFWAHDDSVVPGTTYKYSIRLGFFNPCYETNWIGDENQANMKYQPVLWTKEATTRNNQVQIPPVILFVPRSIADNTSARLDIYKYQYGQWFKRPFLAEPDTQIGDVIKLEAFDPTMLDTQQQPAGRPGMARNDAGSGQIIDIDVDFRADATVVEIVPPTQKTATVNGRSVTDISGELVYKDKNGKEHRIYSNPTLWDPAFQKMLNEVNRSYTADERTRRDLLRNR